MDGGAIQEAGAAPLTSDVLAGTEIVSGRRRSFDGEPRLFLLGTEGERIQISHQFDPLFTVGSSVVDPLPHQVASVYRYLLPFPRIRFLLAEDAGTGNTILAGLLIKELLYRQIQYLVEESEWAGHGKLVSPPGTGVRNP